MAEKKDLLETIDEARAKNVTPKKFEETWGYTLDEHAERMMDFIHELESEEDASDEETEKEETKRTIVCGCTKSATYIIKMKNESKVSQQEMKNAFVQLHMALVRMLVHEIEKHKEESKEECKQESAERFLAYRLRKGGSKRPSRSLNLKELFERMAAEEWSDCSRVGFMVMDFDWLKPDEKEDTLFRTLNQPLPDGVYLERCTPDMLYPDLPIVEAHCAWKPLKRPKERSN